MRRRQWASLLLIFLLLALLLYPITVLEVREEREGKILVREKVSPGDRFEFRYVHSVDRTPVSGLFVITPKHMIKPIETRFSSYGPGLPSMEGKVDRGTGELVARVEVQETKEFSFFVSPMTHPSLVLKGSAFDFSSLREGNVVRMEVRKYPLGGMLIPYGE